MFGKENAEEKHIFSKSFKKFLKKRKYTWCIYSETYMEQFDFPALTSNHPLWKWKIVLILF